MWEEGIWERGIWKCGEAGWGFSSPSSPSRASQSQNLAGISTWCWSLCLSLLPSLSSSSDSASGSSDAVTPGMGSGRQHRSAWQCSGDPARWGLIPLYVFYPFSSPTNSQPSPTDPIPASWILITAPRILSHSHRSPHSHEFPPASGSPHSPCSACARLTAFPGRGWLCQRHSLIRVWESQSSGSVLAVLQGGPVQIPQNHELGDAWARL